MSYTIGVLLPTSRMFPGVDQGFLAGLEAALSGLNPAPRLALELTGAAAQKDVVAEKARRLLLVERADVLVGVLGAGLIPDLEPTLESHRVPLVVCNLGADLPLTGGVHHPLLIQHSLNLWQSMYALAYWAARTVGRRAALACGFHEAGYGVVEACCLGFEQGGGTVLGFGVTHRESAIDDPTAEIHKLASLQPDVLFGLYSGREGVSFMGAFEALGLAGQLPLLSTPLMTHGHWLPQMPRAVAGVRTACSWMPGLWPAADMMFAPAVSGRGPRPAPDVFALLGYEAGLAIRGALAKQGRAFAGVEFSSPRGLMRIDDTQSVVGAGDHLIAIGPTVSGDLAWSHVGPLELPEAFAAASAEVRARTAKSGWINAYLVN